MSAIEYDICRHPSLEKKRKAIELNMSAVKPVRKFASTDCISVHFWDV